MSAKQKLGLCIDDLRLPAPEAIRQAAKMGYDLIELGTVGTEFEPRRFGQTARRHLRRFVVNMGLEIAALTVDIGGKRFADLGRLEEAFDRARAALEMAAQMHVPIVVTELGPITRSDLDAQVFEALQSLGQIADATGTFLALQTGHCDPHFLADLLGRLNCAMIRICYDPGGLLIAGFEPLVGIESLADQIILAHLRDASTPAASEALGRETPLGEGQIDLAAYVACLHEAGYFGPQIVRRLHAADPVAEFENARELLDALLA